MQKGLFSIAGLFFVILIALAMVAYSKTTNSSISSLESDLLEIEHLQFSRTMLENATDRFIEQTILSKAKLSCDEKLIKIEVANSLPNFFNSISSSTQFPKYDFYIQQLQSGIKFPISSIGNYIKVIVELVKVGPSVGTFTFSFSDGAEAVGKISGNKYMTYFKIPPGYTKSSTSSECEYIVEIK